MLSVIVECHTLVCAIPLSWVRRLVLPEELRRIGASLVESGGAHYAAWNLGERLGLRALASACVLLRVPYANAEVPIALITGTCRTVQPIPQRVEIPPELYASRHRAVAGVFVADATHGGALCGLELDVPNLWNSSELAASAQLVRGGKRG